MSGNQEIQGKRLEKMDEVTQQNAALVEQATAAAKSLQDQATHLVQAVSIFNTGDTLSRIPSFATKKKALVSIAARKKQALPDDEERWDEF